MKIQHIKIEVTHDRKQELLARSMIGTADREESRKKYLDLKDWKSYLNLFLATNYALMSVSMASESMQRPDQQNLQRLFLEKSKSQQVNQLCEAIDDSKHKIIKTNIPAQYLKITERGIILDDQLKSLEKELFIEAAGDLYLQRLNAQGNFTVTTSGKIHVLEDVAINGSILFKADAIDVAKRIKSTGNLQLFAQTVLGIRGYVTSKSTLQLVGIEELNVSGLVKGQEGTIFLSSGKVNFNGTVISKKEIVSQSKEFHLAGSLLSHGGTKIKTQDILEAKPGSSMGVGSLSVSSNNDKILLLGDIFVESKSAISSPDALHIDGHFKTVDELALQVNSFSLPGYLEALNGATLNIQKEWVLSGAITSLGKGIHGKIGKLILQGLLHTNGTSLNVDTGTNQGVMLTRGHCTLTGKEFTHHKGSIVFTTGVHQTDFSGDYQDASQLYTPTLFIAKARHIMFLPGYAAFLKDALLTSIQQTTVYGGGTFKLFGPSTFMQITSEGSANFGGVAVQDSLASFPFEKYLEILKLKMLELHVPESSVFYAPTTVDLKKEVDAMALTHPWRSLRKGQGISMVVGGAVKYAGESKLDAGSISVNAAQSVRSQYGSMQAGSFTGHSVGIQAASAVLDHMTIKSYLDKVSVITTESLKLTDTELSGGLQTLISALEADIQQSKLKSSGGDVSIGGSSHLRVKDAQVESQKDTTMRGGQVGVSGSTVKSQAKAILESDTQLAVDTSKFETKGNHFSGEEIGVRQVEANSNSTMNARRDLSIEDYKSTGQLVARSGNKTTYKGTVETKGLDSQAKHTENNAIIQSSESAQFVAERLDQNREIVAESVFIQADEFNDTETSKAKALKTLVLVNEKGTGIEGNLEGDTVVIKMDDFQLKALKQVVAKVTQLHINKDVVVNEDILLNNTLHLWANSLIQKGKITALGDLVAQLKGEVSLYDIMDIKGTGAIIAEGDFKIDRGHVTAEKLYLQSKTKDVTLYRAALKALSDIKISADEGSIKKTGSHVQAGGDVGLKAGKHIESRSEVERVGTGDNFEDKKVVDKIEAGGNLSQEAGGHILFAAVENNAKGNITYQAAGHIVDTALAVESQYAVGNERNYDKGNRVEQSVSKHQAGGEFVSKAGGKQVLYAPEISASHIQIEAQEDVAVHDVHDTRHKQTQSESDGGFFGEERKRQEFSQSAQSKGAKFYGTKRLDIIAGTGIDLTNIESTAPKTSLTSVAGAVRILLGKNQSASSSQEKSSNLLWQKQSSHVEEHKTFTASSFGGSLEINSKETLVESIKGHSLDFTKQLEAQGISVISTYLDEFHKSETKTVQGPSKALAAVVVLAVSICTAGTGAAIGGAVASGMAATGTVATVITGMTAAAFTSLCSQAALALLSNEGNPIKAAESLASTSTLENLGLAMLTAGVTAGVTDAFHIPQSSTQATTIQQIEKQAIQSTVGLTANLVTGQKPEDALLLAAKSAAAGIVSSVASKSIGDAYYNHDVDFIGHKFLHALVGGATGALLSDDPLSGAASGAFGAVTAEMIGELVLMNSHNIAVGVVNNLGESGTPLTPENIQTAIQADLRHKTDFIKLMTSGIALLSGQDVSISAYTASTAIDNNLSHMAYQITELEVFDILERECVGIYDYAKTSLLEAVDSVVGSGKQMTEGVEPEDDPFTSLAGSAIATGTMRGLRVLRLGQKASAQVSQAVIHEAEVEASNQATRTVIHDGEAHSVANRQRLATQLRLEEEGIINQQGRLTQQVIDQAKPIQPGSELSEHFKAFMRERSQDPNLWSKVENPQGALKLHPASQDVHPDLRNIEVHFYKHNETGEIITIRDYKAKANPTYGIREVEGKKLDRSHAIKLLDDARKGEKK